ncbi:unnamed protein product [Angiostrongylus costaricensis]|uniref:Transthyretin-like family protein n=1 Tax=Angiostrongylus costaricensis TaxID=334426 RepID=A0A158PII2_ANGCS|nr:unnamed protein product [Angiostrongylus costaricensis]
MAICQISVSCLLSLPLLVFGTFREQSVAVKGIVNCRGIRQPGAFVQLYDEDIIPVMDSDDLLGSTTADELGVFCVRGYTTEISAIEPYIYIEHNCGYEGLNKKHFFIRTIPPEFIMEGNFSKKTFHMGDIELLTKDAPVQQFERRVLIHHPHRHHHYHHLRHHHQHQHPYYYGKTTLQEQIIQCIPHYVAYRDYYERVVVNGATAYNKTKVEEQAWKEMGEVTRPSHVLEQNETRSFKSEAHLESRSEIHMTDTETREHETRGPQAPLKSAEAKQQELEEQEREKYTRLDMGRRVEEEGLREAEKRKRLDEEKRIVEARIREEQLRKEEEKRRNEEARFREQQLKEEEEMRKLEEERRRIQEERMEIEKQRLKEEEEIRKEKESRYEEERRKEEERRREEAKLREEERRKEEEQRRQEERRRDDERRKEMEARREEHMRRIEEFRRLEEQRRLEVTKFEEERRQWKEKMKEEEKALKKKIETMCSRDAAIRTAEARVKYSDGVDPCDDIKEF